MTAYDENKDYVLIVTRSELNAIIKGLKLRRDHLEKLLEEHSNSLTYADGIRESIRLNGELTGRFIHQKGRRGA